LQYILLAAATFLIGIVTRLEADEPPPAPLHIGDSGDSPPPALGAAPKAGKSLPAAINDSGAPAQRCEMLERGQRGFAVKKWDSASAARATQDQPTTAPQLPGDRVAWHRAFHSAPVPKAVDSGVVQTAGELPLDPVKAAMLPMPASPDLHRDGDGKQPAHPKNIEVPVTPPADSTVVLDDSDVKRLRDVGNCKSARDLKSIGSITADIGVKRRDLTNPETGLPLAMPPECSLGEERIEPRHWERTTFSWVAAATYHRPIYFDDDQLERYGHTFGPVTQTTVSAVKFFATVPLVPYYMGVYPPNECIYDLGLYRPGSCAPYYFDPFPLSVRGAINEGLFLGTIPAL
jgi:hypothetical protein